ncbi:MAG: hypothetical protein V1767_00210 [Chloroflexota bacterium]
MSARLDKLKLVRGGRKWERQDPLDNIGVSTFDLLRDAIKEGKNDLAADLTEYVWNWEIRFRRESNLDLVQGFPEFWMKNYGEDEHFADVYRANMWRTRYPTLPSWPPPGSPKKRALSNFDWAMSYGGTMVRPHRMGRMDGTYGFVLEEYEDRFEIVWDPCGSGGRSRRGDPISATPGWAQPPMNYTGNQSPHPWTWGKKGMMGYCIHCCFAHEIMDVEETGYLAQWICGVSEDPWKTCNYIVYKDLDWIPEHYYTRIGKTKPPVAKPIPKFKDVTKPIKATPSDQINVRWVNTMPMLKKAIYQGKQEEALKLVDRLWAENAIHNTPYWSWVWMDQLIEEHGYNELYYALRWMYSRMEPPNDPAAPKPTKASIPSAEERARKAALWGRGDLSGPNQEGSVRIIDEPKRIVMELNPCGSGGLALMKIDKVDPIIDATNKEMRGALAAQLIRGPAIGPPRNLGVMKVAHPVAWGKVGVPHICTRCGVHFEANTLAHTGYLTTVIERAANATDPTCRWYFYKDLDDVPEEYYNRIGAKKPAPQR